MARRSSDPVAEASRPTANPSTKTRSDGEVEHVGGPPAWGWGSWEEGTVKDQRQDGVPGPLRSRPPLTTAPQGVARSVGVGMFSCPPVTRDGGPSRGFNEPPTREAPLAPRIQMRNLPSLVGTGLLALAALSYVSPAEAQPAFVSRLHHPHARV